MLDLSNTKAVKMLYSRNALKDNKANKIVKRRQINRTTGKQLQETNQQQLNKVLENKSKVFDTNNIWTSKCAAAKYVEHVPNIL